MRQKTIYISLILVLFFYGNSISQTADVLKGCLPLKVNFTSPNLIAYYWDFGDGGSSLELMPSHIFTKPGIYKVNLFEGKNGVLKGTIEITVYADPVITFIGTPVSGCSPLKVAFNSTIIVDTAVKIIDILWSFGDGNNSTQPNPIHTYSNAGKYNVSIKIVTNIGECDKTQLVENYIDVQGINANFSLTNANGCNIPSTITLLNLTKNDNNYIYTWDFGNGASFSGFDPKNVVYNSKGNYAITLKVKDKSGCESIISKKVVVGPPEIILKGNDSFCFKSNILFKNETVADSFFWQFGNDPFFATSKNREPNVIYKSKGTKTITLTAISGTCRTDTSFNIFLEDLDTTFTISLADCFKDVQLFLEAKEKGNYTYIWNDSISGNDKYNYLYKSPIRDSLYRFGSDTVFQSLLITSTLGCTAFSEKYFIHERPNAIMTPSNKDGCAPLTVEFEDLSESNEKIIRYTLIYGDGQMAVKTTDLLGSHVYTKPGEYYVKLIIENIKGCIDTSEGFWIFVGEKITPTYTIDKTTICIGESININKTIKDPRIDSWHVYTDNGRFSHCWKSDDATHRFVNDIGTFPLIVTSEYNGCFADAIEMPTITVKGAKAIMKYMVNCSRPYEVMFTSNSKHATDIIWNFGDTTTSQFDSLTHKYLNRGAYKVTLSAEDKQSGCPANVDARTVYVKEIKAVLNLPSKSCDNVLYTLDAKLSQDVDKDCSKGYLYRLPNHRPRKNNKDTIMHQFAKPGYQEVTLVVEDINGCKDSVTKSTTVYSIKPDFLVDKDLVCLPADLIFKDASKSDTSLVSWNWSFGSKVQNPNYTLSNQDSVRIKFKVTDAVGCMDSISKSIRIYKPTSRIQFSKGPGLCIGDSVQFNAPNYTQGGSSLKFDWDFGVYGTSKLQNPKITFDKTGTYKIILNYVELNSNCGGSDTITFVVVKIPEALFDVPLDTPLCYPQIFIFKNNSSSEGPVLYSWTFDSVIIRLEDPTFAFGKGKHKVKLLVQSIYGCSSTIEKEYILVGPEGKIAADKTNICKGEEGTFSAINLVDVSQFEWEFNDGRGNFPNMNPVKYRFDSSGQRSVILILKSTETGCEHIDSLTINVPDVTANFEHVDSVSYCPGLAVLNNTSRGADQFEWKFGEGMTSTSGDTSIYVKYKTLGKKAIELTAIDSKTNCRNSITKEIDLKDVIEFYKFPNVFSPNGDGVNDFFNVAVKPKYEEFIEVVQFKVYNRWGKLIYNNENRMNGWDGRFEDVEAPVEVYAYFIEIKIRDCNNQVKKGNVTIVR